MKIRISFRLIVLFASLISGCTEEMPGNVDLKIRLSYAVDDVPLYLDSLMYANDAGNAFEVNRLEYYISNITLHTDDLEDYISDQIFYVNAREAVTNELLLENVPDCQYTHLTFQIGLDSMHNISYALPNTAENINMAWPDMMGGGYHFLKMEGHFLLSSISTGYAVHLGNNKNLVNCTANGTFYPGHGDHSIQLEMNLNEWYRDPNAFDLAVDGNYTMGDPVAMQKIAANGYDVFTLKN